MNELTLESSEQSAGNAQQRSPQTAVLQRAQQCDLNQSPLLVFYEVTRACDLVCQHCRACAQTRPDTAELTTGESLQLIDQLAQFPAPPLLILTGGDPFKRPDIFDLIGHAADAGLDVSITPSATPLVTKQAVRRLRDAGISRMAVSIDGADAATHDAVRGVPGSFDRSLQILADGLAAGIPTQVNTTLTPGNFDQIEEMAELLQMHRIAMWSVFFLVPVGRAQLLQRLTAHQCELAFARLWQQAQRRPYAIKTTEAPHYRRYVLQHRRPQSTGAPLADPPVSFARSGINDGKGVMFVSHAGLIHPSGFLPVVCGTFPHQHLVQVYQNSPIFRALRDADRLEGKCHDCEFRHLCGGSRARAYAVTGNPLAEEPDCSYIPRSFIRPKTPVRSRRPSSDTLQRRSDECQRLLSELRTFRAATSSDTASRAVVVQSLRRLVAQVQQYFDREQYSRLYDDPAGASPMFRANAQALSGERVELGRLLAQLIQLALIDDGADPYWRTSLAKRFDEFHERLASHVAAEIELLQAVLLDGVGKEN